MKEGVRKLILPAAFFCECCSLLESLHNSDVVSGLSVCWQKQKLVQRRLWGTCSSEQLYLSGWTRTLDIFSLK